MDKIAFSVQRDDLKRALDATAPIACKKSPMPILGNVVLTCDAGKLQVTSTDLSISVAATVPCDLAAQGSACLSAKTFQDVVKSLPVGEIKATGTTSLELRVGKIRFKLPTMPASDFPTCPAHPAEGWQKLDADVLETLVSTTAYAMSQDESRPHLNALLFECEAKVLRMVATDGHRLSLAEHDCDAEPFSMLIPARGIAELKRLLSLNGDCEVARDAKFVFYRRGDVTFSCKLAEENFVPWAKVVPKKCATTVEVGREDLIGSLKRIGIVSDGNRTVKVSAGDFGLRIRAEAGDVGEGSEELGCDIKGPEVEIGLSSRYLLDALQPLTEDKVRLEFGGALDAAAIKPVGPTVFTGVVMPVRI